MANTRNAETKASAGEILAWCFYDFANSGYPTVILTVAFSIYFTGAVVGNENGRGDLLWGASGSIANGIVAIISPLLGALADFSASKKRLLLVFAIVCILATAGLYFVGPGMVTLGMVLFIISAVGFAAANVFYNAFLPELVEPARTGTVSGYGWAAGYIGALLCLFLCFPFLKGGYEGDSAATFRTSFPLVAIFFLVFTLPFILWVKERAVPQQLPEGRGYLSVGFQRLTGTFKEIRNHRNLFAFLLAFFVYNDGITTTIYFAVIFAKDSLGFSVASITKLFIVLQLAAFAGAFVLGRVFDIIGAKKTIAITIVVWIVSVIGAYFTYSQTVYYFVAGLAGLAMGSSQAASRGFVALLSPKDRVAEFYGFFAVAGKFSAIFGPLVFGVVSAAVDQRTAILSILAFFLIGGALLLRVEDIRADAQLDAI